MLKYVVFFSLLMCVGVFPMPFETVFFAVFIGSLMLIIFWWVVFLVRALRGKQGLQVQVSTENHPVVREREIIREIVKIRCPYCGNLYDEKLDKCPHCGGKKS